MYCGICNEEYNQQEREPRVLPCGHTVCLRCLQLLQHWECPTCRKLYSGPPESLPKNFELLELMERLRIQGNNTRFPDGWCKGCRAPATTQCWDVHEVLNPKAALEYHLRSNSPFQWDALMQASFSIGGLQTECKGERAMKAITLLDRESWELTLRGGDHVLTGVVGTTTDPLIKAMCLIMAARVDLTQKGVRPKVQGPNGNQTFRLTGFNPTFLPNSRPTKLLLANHNARVPERPSLVSSPATAPVLANHNAGISKCTSLVSSPATAPVLANHNSGISDCTILVSPPATTPSLANHNARVPDRTSLVSSPAATPVLANHNAGVSDCTSLVSSPATAPVLANHNAGVSDCTSLVSSPATAPVLANHNAGVSDRPSFFSLSTK